MIWVLQDGELWPIDQWVALKGEEKYWTIWQNIAANTSYSWSIYTVPAGKKLYIVRAIMGGTRIALWHLYKAGPTTIFRVYTNVRETFWAPLTPPATVAAGETLVLYITNEDLTNSGNFPATVTAYELEV